MRSRVPCYRFISRMLSYDLVPLPLDTLLSFGQLPPEWMNGRMDAFLLYGLTTLYGFSRVV